MSQRATLRIQGRVQGVFFRETARREAERLGLSGWVKNLRNGDVAAVAEGPLEALEAFVSWCRSGPPTARVTHVDCTYTAATGEFLRFSVER